VGLGIFIGVLTANLNGELKRLTRIKRRTNKIRRKLMTDEITNDEDIIDSRDIIARIEELQEDTDSLDDSESFELKALIALDQNGKDAFEDNWKYGVSLIRDDYFETHARELASDIGAISDDMSWPAHCIDWEQAANELQADYALLEFDGVEYWAR